MFTCTYKHGTVAGKSVAAFEIQVKPLEMKNLKTRTKGLKRAKITFEEF